MALKFLYKKGWHTWSIRNIENVWKAEQKHAAEEKKLDELRKQIVEERERAEFRDLLEKAGLIPKQERLEFLYDSGLAVGRPGGSDNFKEAFPKTEEPPSSSSAAAKEGSSSSVPGALFATDKPQSANESWRKLHSDPLLMIKQREQEALSRIKNNPVQMAMIRKQVESKKPTEKARDKKEHQKKHHKDASKHWKQTSDSEDDAEMEWRKSGHRKTSKYVKHSESEDESHKRARRSGNYVEHSDAEDESRYRARQSGKTHVTYSDSEDEYRNKARRSEKNHVRHSGLDDTSRNRAHRSEKNRVKYSDSEDELHNRGRQSEKNYVKHSDTEDGLHNRGHRSEKHHAIRSAKDDGQGTVKGDNSEQEIYSARGLNESHKKRQFVPPKLSEEGATRLKEMQMDAELHEEQRWKRLKKADENDAREAT